MRSVDIREVKARLSKLVDQAAEGDAFIIAKDGRPLVMVMPAGSITKANPRIGFLNGEIIVPGDFDRMGTTEIQTLFRR